MAFGLYVHWPYCESKCPYCDFNSHVAVSIDKERWIAAYRQEIRRVAEVCPDEILSTIFMGGGTPSLMAPEIVDAIVSTAKACWRTTNNLEVSMEANPGSVDAGRFQAYASAGVNRVSLGIQSLDETHLKLLGRLHGRDDALRAVEVAQTTFERVNLDLIYARQTQTLEEWERELTEAIGLGTTHLSLYQLTIEDGTVFAKRHAAGHLRGLPEEDTSADMFELTQRICGGAGLPAYEVSNHARPGEECRHNLIYWRGGTYAAVGPGAHGRLNVNGHRIATEAIRDPFAWLTAVRDRKDGDLARTVLSNEDRATEFLLMGLRLGEGVQTRRLAELGIETDGWQSLDDMMAEGYLEHVSGAIRTTPKGRLLLNAVIARLLSDMRRSQP